MTKDEFNIFVVRVIRKDGEPLPLIGVTLPIIPGTDAEEIIEAEISRLEAFKSTDRTLKINRDITILKHCLEIIELERFYHELLTLERARTG